MMNQITILKTNSKSIKKVMTLAGIKVLRCSQNGKGILVTVSKSDLVKAISFFNEYSLTRANGLPVSGSISVGSNYADFGTVFRTEK
jgi:hypothetical protein